MALPNALALSFETLHQVLEQSIAGAPRPSLVPLLAAAPLTLAQLGQKFQLSPFEQSLLLLAAAPELDANFQTIFAQAQGSNSPYPTLSLALGLFAEADGSVLAHQCPLHRWQLLQSEGDRWFAHAPLTLDRRIFCYLLGFPDLAPPLDHWLTTLQPDAGESLPPSYQALSQQLIAAWSAPERGAVWPLIALNGVDALTHQQIAAIACNRLGLKAMLLPATALPSLATDLKTWQCLWEREAILSDAVLLLSLDSLAAPEPATRAALSLFLNTLNTPVIVSSHDRLPPLERAVMAIDVPPLSSNEQLALWQQHLEMTGPNGHLLDSADLKRLYQQLTAQFQLTPTGIRNICGQVQPDEVMAMTTERLGQQLWHLCRRQARPQLDDLAQRIPAQAGWTDLVLPDRQQAQLADIAHHLNYRARVYQDWGFTTKGDRGLGITALFHGESGTGKTLAAEVIAGACNLDLYRIDLSTVVSKYIGETEKNLRRIFDAAEAGGVILLFDEADALFGKRTEVKESRDRHANIEVSYLLQRMEAYRGLAILTSNFKQNLDPAFLRRLRFIVAFPFPDAQARAAIWQQVFPAQTPTHNLDYARLGQLKISGGNIRNIALNAAFLAAGAQQPVTMTQIRQAAQRDYLKLEKLLTRDELNGWESG
ncbi:MAG: ATP-binding protein [Cyanobacteria bacterium P01_G01_bin.54]